MVVDINMDTDIVLKANTDGHVDANIDVEADVNIDICVEMEERDGHGKGQ